MLDRRKSRVEALALDFERFGADLLDGLAAEPDPDLALAEKVKLGCTLAMLTCLDREHRMAYLLAEVFDVAHAEAAKLCDVAEDVHRQRVSRARRKLEAFTLSFCGLVNDAAPCSCPRRVAKAQALGRLHRDKPLMERRSTTLAQATNEMESLHATARVLRAHPQYRAPGQLLEFIRATLDKGDLRIL